MEGEKKRLGEGLKIGGRTKNDIDVILNEKPWQVIFVMGVRSP